MCVYTVPVLIYLLKGQYYTFKKLPASTVFLKKIFKQKDKKNTKEQRKERLILVVANNVNLLFIFQCPSHGEARGGKLFFLNYKERGELL